MAVAIIIEGGLVRAAYVDGKLVEPEVFDFDLEGLDVEELQDLLDRIDAELAERVNQRHPNALQEDLLTYRNDVLRALSYGDGLGA